MNKELDNKLVKAYPKIFADRHKDMKETAMCWGFECDEGWYNLINNLCVFLQFHIDNNKYPQVIATQVKEKYGRLCFYVQYDIKYDGDLNGSNAEFLRGAIAFAETYSESICEVCGAPGENLTKGGSITGWRKTLCFNDAIKLGYDKPKLKEK